MNFKDLINEVLIRLREDTITVDWVGDINASSEVTPYQKVIGSLVNDSKRTTEIYHDWFILRETLEVPTIVDTRSYSLLAGQEIKLLDVICQDTGLRLTQVSKEYMNSVKYPSSSSGEPRYYAFDGADSANNLKVELEPTPDVAQTIAFDVVKYQDELKAFDTIVRIPEKVVILGAWARAIAERGEDGGTISSAVAAEARESLTLAIQVDASNGSFERDWTVV